MWHKLLKQRRISYYFIINLLIHILGEFNLQQAYGNRNLEQPKKYNFNGVSRRVI